eukprot:1337058-Amorphochlora_amoeboformis.AAC.1
MELYPQLLNWNTASLFCEKRGMALVSIHNQADNDALFALVSAQTFENTDSYLKRLTWLGMYDHHDE